jgi:PTS system mannitol-specific IIC component
MIGNICALSFFTLVDFGLVAPASPGSLISIILMSPKGKTLLGILGVLIGTVVSFLLAWPMVKSRPDFQGESEGAEPVPGMDGVSKIVFACDAGMGSSALGATRFKARLMQAGLGSIKCTNCAVGDIPADASLVVCQKELEERALRSGKRVIAITNFLSDPALDALLSSLQAGGGSGIASGSINPSISASGGNTAAVPELLLKQNILTSLPSESKEAAIRRAGALLAESGYVDASYADAMLEREKTASTYMGMGLAIPHGTAEAKKSVKHSGIVVLQYPDGVDFDGEKARLLVGIAGAGGEHIGILAKVAEALDDENLLEKLSTTKDPQEIFNILK